MPALVVAVARSCLSQSPRRPAPFRAFFGGDACPRASPGPNFSIFSRRFLPFAPAIENACAKFKPSDGAADWLGRPTVLPSGLGRVPGSACAGRMRAVLRAVDLGQKRTPALGFGGIDRAGQLWRPA